MADAAILAAGGANAPLSYLVPGATVILIKQIHVSYVDNGASGDWLPAVRITSDSGHTMGLAADQGVVVTAGNDAGVSFFPRVGRATVAAKVFAGRWFGKIPTIQTQTIPTGVVTPLTFPVWTGTSDPAGLESPITFSGNPAGNFVLTFWEVMCWLTVAWPAGNYDRYIEIYDGGNTEIQPNRSRAATTPNGDIQTVAALEQGVPNVGVPLQVNAFQASGADKAVSGQVEFIGVPSLVPPGGWP